VLVLLDTSFLLTMLREHMDFGEEIRTTVPGPLRIVTIDVVRFELGRLARRGSSATGGLAKLALEQLERKRVPVMDTELVVKDTDTAILTAALSQKGPVAVATLDRRLRETPT
jgi:rRNA-processing protein FCF1